MTHKLTLSLLLLMPIFSLLAQDWHQFRGPNRDGSAVNASIANSWSEKTPELIWKKDLGSGFSEVLTSGDKIVTMCSEKIDSVTGSEYIIAFETKTGKELWKTELDSIFIDVDSFGDGPRSTPAVDKEHAYCLSSYGKLFAIALNSGQIKWTIDFVKEFESTLPRWAFSTSPIILDDAIIIETGGKDARGFASIDKITGNINWIKGNAQAYYSSPSIAKINEKTNLIFTSDSMLIALDTEGNELWSYRMPLRYPTASPLFVAPNKVFVSSAGNAGGFLIEIVDGKPSEVFKSTTMKNHFSSSCYLNGYIYGFSNATLRCISAENAETKWSKRGLGKGTLILVNDKLLVLSDKGVLKLAATNPEVYSELGSIQAIEGKSWTAPSFHNGYVYLRNLNEIAVYKIN